MTEPDGGEAYAADVDAAAHVVVDDLDDALELDGSDGHHLARVRRLRPDERLTVADGRGCWREFVVVDARRGRLRARATGPVLVEPFLEPGLAVAFALMKGDGPERVVQQLTELGVDRIVPLVSARSIVRRDEARAAAARERMVAVARAAAMQCRRSRIPQIDVATNVEALRGALPSDTTLLLATREDASDPGPPSAAGGWTVVVGPEGGFDESDLAALGPAAGLAVGPHVLRASTACVAVAAVLTTARTRASTHGASRSEPAT